jgi:hypothetical protein
VLRVVLEVSVPDSRLTMNAGVTDSALGMCPGPSLTHSGHPMVGKIAMAFGFFGRPAAQAGGSFILSLNVRSVCKHSRMISLQAMRIRRVTCPLLSQ